MLPTSGNIAINLIPQVNGSCVCEVTPSIGTQAIPTAKYYGQTPNHAIAIALENLARSFRREASERDIDLPSGNMTDKRFHVILHYERVAIGESKFDAMEDTLMGNTVVENAEISIIQVAPDLPVEALNGRHAEP
jgi:hypothetical protein